MAKVLFCDIIVSEFELQSPYYDYFRAYTPGKLLCPPAMG